MTASHPASASLEPSATPPSLEAILAELRRLAVGALDGGHPLVAARIAATADQVEAAAWPLRPPRPNRATPSIQPG